MNSLPQIRFWPNHYRKLVQIFLILVLSGYGVGFLNLIITQQTTPKGIATHLRGLSEEEMETAEEIVLPKPFKELIVTTHNHLLGLASIFGVLGFLFLHTGFGSQQVRLMLAVEPMISLLLTFMGIWLTRFIGEIFAPMVWIAGLLTHPVFLFLLITVWVETIIPDKKLKGVN